MDSKTRILSTAVKIFAEKGKHGAVMEEIAAGAGINKAMIYYYFGGREALYRATLTHVLASLMHTVRENLSPQDFDPAAPAELIRKFIRAHYRAVSMHPDRAKVLLGAIVGDQGLVREVVTDLNRTHPVTDLRKLMGIIDRGVADGALRRIDSAQLILSIIGMNLFYIFGKPMAETFLKMRVGDERRFHEARLESIVDLVLYGVLEREES